MLRYARGALAKASYLLLTCVAIAALCSGAASLTLEVVWSKALVVPLGNSSDATALVLAGFMLGIACGAQLGARLALGPWRSLSVYAGLELLLGLFALWVPTAVRQITGLHVDGSPWFTPGLAFGMRLVASGALITLPCLVMGASLPLLLATPVARAHSRRFAGFLYGTNTLGATAAAVVTGFYGVAHWGISGCSRRASLLSATAAVLAWSSSILLSKAQRNTTASSDRNTALLGGRNPEESAEAEPIAPAANPDTKSAERCRRQALAGTFVSGFALLSAEVLWARLLTFVFGHDTYAFATLLSVVLLGLGVGGLAYATLANCAPRRVAGWTLAGFGLTLLVSFYGAGWLLIQRGRDPFGLGDFFVGKDALYVEILRELSFTPFLLLLPCVLSGLGYPALIALFAGERGSISRATGSVGLANGVGATLGAATTALGMVSWLGLQGALLLAALATLAVASWLLWTESCGRLRRWPALVPVAGAILLWIAMPRDVPKRVLLSAVGPKHQTLLHYAEARTASVAVIKNSIHGERQLLVNAVNEVTTRLVHDQSFKLLGQLGPLLHEDPKRAVMICLGAGLAAGSALTHPLERLDVVDLLRAVRDGARHFPEENNHVLDDPRLVLHVNDGRQHLLTTNERYDLAIVDSTHPKSVDSWILYTREFFQLLRSRLNAGGIVVQWLPLHGLSEREFRSVVATFASAFPQMTLWASVGYETYGQVGYAKLVGQHSEEPMRMDIARLESRLTQPRVQQDLARYGMGQVPEILDQFIAGPERIREYVTGSPLLSDDHPFLAYLTELSAGRPMTPDRLLVVREPVGSMVRDFDRLDEERRSAIERAFDAQGLVISGQLERARSYAPTGEKIRLYVEQTKTTLPYYQALAQKYDKDLERLFEAGTQLGALGHGEAARPIFAAGLRLHPESLRFRLNAGLLELEAGNSQLAVKRFMDLQRRHPSTALVLQNLGAALLAQGDFDAAERILKQAIAAEPERVGARLALAEAEMASGNWSAAKSTLKALVHEDPSTDAALSRLATVEENLGDMTAAVELSARATRLNPYSDVYAVALGRRLLTSRPDEAARVLERAERYFPDSSLVKATLGEAWLRLQDWQKASESLVSALELDPSAGEVAVALGQALVGLDKRIEAKHAFCLAWKLHASRQLVSTAIRSLGGKLEDCEQAPM